MKRLVTFVIMSKYVKRAGARLALFRKPGEEEYVKLPASIYRLAALIKEDMQSGASVLPHAEDIAAAAAELIEPYILGILRPNFKGLTILATNPAEFGPPAYFTLHGYKGRPTIFLKNLVLMLASLGAGVPSMSEDTLWTMLAIVFCHEMVHAWEGISCPCSDTRNRCNGETFATFVTTVMAAAQGVAAVNQMGIDLIEAMLQDATRAFVPPAFYKKCYVDAPRTKKQDLRLQTCASMSGPDVEYGGRRQTRRKSTRRRGNKQTRSQSSKSIKK